MGCCDSDVWCNPRKQGLAGIKKNRCCTDILMLAIWIAAFLAMLALFVEADKAGAEPYRIINGVSMNGTICGQDSEKDNKYAFWPNPLVYEALQCIDSCDLTNSVDNKYAVVLYPSFTFGRYCIPDLASMANSTLAESFAGGFLSDFEDAQEQTARIMTDLVTAKSVIIGCAAGTFVMAIIVMFMIQKLAGCLVWGIIFICWLSTVALGGLAYKYSQEEKGSSDDLAEYLEITAYVLWGVAVIGFFIICFLRTQIRIAIEVTKQAAKAMEAMPFLYLFPLVGGVIAVLYFAFWVVITGQVFSVINYKEGPTDSSLLTYRDSAFGITEVGQRNDNPSTMMYPSRDEKWNDALWLLFFHFLWQTQAVVYWSYLVIAGAAADWYFTPWDGKGGKKRGNGADELTNWPIASSIYRSTLWNMGTVQTCAFLLAVVQFIRYVIIYLEKTTKGDGNSKLKRAVICLISCCLKCVECCLDKLNKNGLVWTAVYGDNFFVSCCSAFALIFRNLARVAAINVVSTIVIKLGKLMTAMSLTAIAVAILHNVEPFKSDLYSLFIPGIVIFLLCWCIASVCFSVFGAVLDTNFICFLIDSEVNGDGCMLASEELQKVVGKYKDESNNQAVDIQKHRSDRRKKCGMAEDDGSSDIELHKN